jgi:hypothetical protein
LEIRVLGLRYRVSKYREGVSRGRERGFYRVGEVGDSDGEVR